MRLFNRFKFKFLVFSAPITPPNKLWLCYKQVPIAYPFAIDLILIITINDSLNSIFGIKCDESKSYNTN